MTADNFEQTLQAFRDRSPFRPFTVVLHSGRQFEVDHPGALVQRDGVAIFVGPGGVPVVFDHEGVEHFAGDLADRPSA
jgi:carbamate kinase